MIGESGLETINFGITWSRVHKNGNVMKSAIDHGLTNKPLPIKNHFKIPIDYSDHSMICVDMNIKVQKSGVSTTYCKDFRKIRKNPQILLNKLASIEWELFKDMEDMDDMENFWSRKINECLDCVAPQKTRSFKHKIHYLPKEVQELIKIRENLEKKHKSN